MSLGPVELLVVKFPGNRFTGDVLPALGELVENGTVRIADLLFVHKDAAGRVSVLEFSDLDPDQAGAWAPLVTDQTPLLNEDDARALASSLGPDSSAGVMLFENLWARRFADAVLDSGGEVTMNERIPRVVVEEVAAALG